MPNRSRPRRPPFILSRRNGGRNLNNMQPRKPERGRFRLSSLRIILLLLAGGFLALWFAAREPGALQLRYGEFKRLLNVPGVTLRNVKVGKAEISGEIVT